MPLVIWNTAAPRQPILLSLDDSIFLQFTTVLSRHCAQISSLSLTEVLALAINLGSRSSRVFTRIPAKHPGTSLSLTCSRHCTYPPVPSWVVQVHCSPSGGALHMASRRVMATRPAALAAGVPRLATYRLWRLSGTGGRAGARSRAGLKIGAKWRAVPRRTRAVRTASVLPVGEAGRQGAGVCQTAAQAL